MISLIRDPLSKVVRPIVIFFAKLGIHPTVFTVMGLLLSISAGIFLGIDNFLAGFILIWIAGAMDFLDGGVARYRGLDSEKGSFLDSIFDRLSDLAVFVGIIWSDPVDGVTGMVMVGSALMISYIRAKGESVGVTKMSVGLMERAERWLGLMVLLFVSLLVPNQAFINPLYTIQGIEGFEGISYFSIGYMILTGLCVITVIQRFIYVSIQLTKAETVQDSQKT
ncbi:MAG: CDP-alcohol phosphatidyltransferase family protein [Candidatus Heimdallarchaeota archaeon]|nr:CDP-alcohol phosphatidyltransferase family protein [Candidatus Heimdallarchaeota archaeon]MCK4876861.1 CDP-alcohol phosphatidyltransferase family protein [Candidatus Heimdallarchaeota archaeon]